MAVLEALSEGRALSASVIFPEQCADDDPLLILAPRQLETLVLTGCGYTARNVAALLNRSTKTIDSHKAGIKERLKIPHHIALATYAAHWLHEHPLLAQGMVSPPEKNSTR